MVNGGLVPHSLDQTNVVADRILDNEGSWTPNAEIPELSLDRFSFAADLRQIATDLVCRYRFAVEL